MRPIPKKILTITLIPTFALGLLSCEGALERLSCAHFDGRLRTAPGLFLGDAQERCGTLDTFAYMADAETIMVAFHPSARDPELQSVLQDTVVELTLGAPIVPGMTYDLPHGKVSEVGEDGVARVTAVVTAGTVYVEKVKLEDELPVGLTLSWDLSFGDEGSDEGTWLHIDGRDTMNVSTLYCDM